MSRAESTLKQLRTVTIAEASERLNVSPDMIRKWCVQGKVRYFQDVVRKHNSTKGGAYHIVEGDLVIYVQQLLQGQQPPDVRKGFTTANAVRAAESDEHEALTRGDISDLLPAPSERRFSIAGRRG